MPPIIRHLLKLANRSLTYAQKPQSGAHRVGDNFRRAGKTSEFAGNFLANLICIGCGHHPTSSHAVLQRMLASHRFDVREMPVFIGIT